MITLFNLKRIEGGKYNLLALAYFLSLYEHDSLFDFGKSLFPVNSVM